MIKGKFVIMDLRGLHLRPAQTFCEKAVHFKASVYILIRTANVNGKSVLGVLSAGIKYGDEIELVCEGEDETAAFEQLGNIITEMAEKNGLDKKKG